MLTVTAIDGSACEYARVTRYCTDEHNNLCVFGAESELVGLHAADQWRSAVLQGEEN